MDNSLSALLRQYLAVDPEHVHAMARLQERLAELLPVGSELPHDVLLDNVRRRNEFWDLAVAARRHTNVQVARAVNAVTRQRRVDPK